MGKHSVLQAATKQSNMCVHCSTFVYFLNEVFLVHLCKPQCLCMQTLFVCRRNCNMDYFNNINLIMRCQSSSVLFMLECLQHVDPSNDNSLVFNNFYMNLTNPIIYKIAMMVILQIVVFVNREQLLTSTWVEGYCSLPVCMPARFFRHF